MEAAPNQSCPQLVAGVSSL